MAAFAKVAATLLTINLGLIGLFDLGSNMTLPVLTSLGPPSMCITQLPVYERIGTLQTSLVATLVSSILLCGYVVVALEDENLATMDEKARRLLRACLLLGIITSAACIVIGLATYIDIFQVKVTVLACASAGARVFLVASYPVAAVVGAFMYWKFAKAAVSSNRSSSEQWCNL